MKSDQYAMHMYVKLKKHTIIKILMQKNDRKKFKKWATLLRSLHYTWEDVIVIQCMFIIFEFLHKFWETTKTSLRM